MTALENPALRQLALKALAQRAGSATGAGIGTFSAAAFLVILSKRYSIGRDTNTGPFGAPIANWQARWIVAGKSDFALTP